MQASMLLLIPVLPLLGAIILGVLNRRATRVVAGSIASAMVGISAVLSFATLATVAGHHGEALAQTVYTWMEVGSLSVDIGFAVDPLAAVMICVVTGVGFLIHVYSIGYMDEPKDSNSTWRFFAYLNLFVFNMLLLVMGDNFLLMFVGWEGVGMCSYLLIGFWFENSNFAAAGKKAFITNRVGDFMFILGLFWLFWALGEHTTLQFSELAEVIHEHPNLLSASAVTGICLLLFGGATGKSAQIPLFVWLPDAMAGPTPVSALIHAATMVTAGIYMLCRLNFLFVMSPVAMGVVATIGALTALLAATIAITQNDIKKVLAYSTVSQLGYMFLGVGVGGFAAGFFHVMTHAFFKALLFLGAGAIIHALHHEQDMRHMGGLRKLMPKTFWVYLMAYLAIIGVPGFAGFFSKDEILWLTFSTEVFGHDSVMPTVLWGIGFLTAGLTAFYMSRLMFMTFWGEFRGHHKPHDTPAIMLVPLAVLAVLSVIGGFANLPHWVPAGELVGVLHHFFEPTFEAAHGLAFERVPESMEYVTMAATIVLVAVSVGAAYFMYVVRPELPGRVAAKVPKFYKGSLNKWYVDEIYGAVLIQPLFFASRHLLWAIFDAQVIDGVVNGAGQVSSWLGRFYGRVIHNGQVQVYALAISCGTALLVLAFALGS